uniref:Uncharacterized protein n=1 Tax=viral metagenome TaxID=1070528 RepID=A0A6H1ZQA3_9ZZZZ
MELKDLLKQKNFQPKHKVDYSFQDLGLEMQDYFKTNIWWIFHRNWGEEQIRDAFIACKRAKITKVSYLVGILNKQPI